MKYLLTIFSAAAFLLTGCSSNSTESTSDAAESVIAVCLWKEIAVRDTPGDKGKYQTALYLGEKATVLPDTAIETSSGKETIYRKIELSDKTQGWVRQDFIALGRAAAFRFESPIYRRPDMMTVSDKKFGLADFVVIKNSADGGWAEVIGKRVGDSWFSTGWVKTSDLSTEDVDVAFSVFYTKAMEITDPLKRAEALQQILINPEFNSSSLKAQFMRESVETEEDLKEEESGDEVTTESDTVNQDQ